MPMPTSTLEPICSRYTRIAGCHGQPVSSAVVHAAVGCGEAGGRYIGGEGRRGGKGGRRCTGPLGSALSSWKGGVVNSASSDPPIWWPCLYWPVWGVQDMEVSIYSPILHAGLDGVRNLPGRSGAVVVGV